jgi:hypothetical protein
MAETTNTKSELLEAIQGVPPLPPLVANALGVVDPRTFFETGEGASVEGYFVKISDTLAQAYVVTPSVFVLAEVAKSGDRQIVSVPLSRIRQIIDSDLQTGHKLTVEIDAGVQTIVNSHRRSELDPEAEVHVQHVNYAMYLIESADDGENVALRNFATALRGALGGR